MKDKLFSCVWLAPTYSISHNTLEKIGFFIDANGYDTNDIYLVNLLEVGQNLILDNANHFITRVK